MLMALIAMFLNIDQNRIALALNEAGQQLNGSEGEVVLDFSSVRRVDSAGLQAMEDFAGRADEKTIKVALRNVDVDVYRVLKLMKLTRRFSFLH